MPRAIALEADVRLRKAAVEPTVGRAIGRRRETATTRAAGSRSKTLRRGKHQSAGWANDMDRDITGKDFQRSRIRRGIGSRTKIGGDCAAHPQSPERRTPF